MEDNERTVPVFKLEEEFADLRSNEVAYKLTVENPSLELATLMSLEPKVPEGARLVGVTDTSMTEANVRRGKLLRELNDLLRVHLLQSSASYRKQYAEAYTAAAKDMWAFSVFMKIYAGLLTSKNVIQERAARAGDTISFKIESHSDGVTAARNWINATTDPGGIVASVFEAKLQQLADIEDSDLGRSERGVAVVDGGSFFAATFVIKFRRPFLEPRKYQIGFETEYSGPDGQQMTNSTATNVRISPHPFVLSLIAIMSAVLGVLLKLSLSDTVEPLNELLKQAGSGQLLVGPIVALIFFNVYEYTSLAKGLTMGVSWRSALLIGALCGIAQDRVLGAIKALIGV